MYNSLFLLSIAQPQCKTGAAQLDNNLHGIPDLSLHFPH